MSEPRLIFVTGAARSGKSHFAERVAAATGGSVLYVATAEALDSEMRERVSRHRERRPATWRTVEARRGVADRLREDAGPTGTMLLDCLSLLVSNLLLDATAALSDAPDLEARVWREVEAEMVGLLGFARERGVDLVCVSNEVGWGVVPDHRLGRVYRDLLGRANQWMAARATDAVLLVAGLPVVLKGDPERGGPL
ncbi:bifunctional adenosylcobinamide kinase/adenosylcobinamide-phosphate guanylyltransferase [Rubrobacter indicoceani]|uniref:bifunctional adenosylcobinamide kinase/adenosylcobinamide-phosphate guanylyltransferase n=1 Tax=Rubrobacter indicoceani TaxID=2051957 RepID=UPI000E5C028E|nr:bifunctional adenosylcobinamide kinase/adenosylcobinamide-phosphate guanylyltransferase [Rubrobacter indicoceani]